MKNKFCDQCRAGFTIPAERVRALLPEDKDRFDNASASGVWKRSIGVAARYRLINQTLHCRGPKLLIFEGPAHLAEEAKADADSEEGAAPVDEEKEALEKQSRADRAAASKAAKEAEKAAFETALEAQAKENERRTAQQQNTREAVQEQLIQSQVAVRRDVAAAVAREQLQQMQDRKARLEAERRADHARARAGDDGTGFQSKFGTSIV